MLYAYHGQSSSDISLSQVAENLGQKTKQRIFELLVGHKPESPDAWSKKDLSELVRWRMSLPIEEVRKRHNQVIIQVKKEFSTQEASLASRFRELQTKADSTLSTTMRQPSTQILPTTQGDVKSWLKNHWPEIAVTIGGVVLVLYILLCRKRKQSIKRLGYDYSGKEANNTKLLRKLYMNYMKGDIDNDELQKEAQKIIDTVNTLEDAIEVYFGWGRKINNIVELDRSKAERILFPNEFILID